MENERKKWSVHFSAGLFVNFWSLPLNMSYKDFRKIDYSVFVSFNKKEKLPSKTLAHFEKV